MAKAAQAPSEPVQAVKNAGAPLSPAFSNSMIVPGPSGQIQSITAPVTASRPKRTPTHFHRVPADSPSYGGNPRLIATGGDATFRGGGTP